MDPITILSLLASSGLLSGLSGSAGKSGKWSQLSTLNPQQQQAQMQALQQALQGLQNPYEGFEPLANQARTNFETQTLPSIAERFTNMGGGGQRSSAFQGALGAAGSGFENGLAALKSQYGFQNRGQSLQQLQLGLQPNFENAYTPGGHNFLSSILSGGSGVLGQLGLQGAKGRSDKGLSFNPFVGRNSVNASNQGSM